ncbi:MAG: mercury resistance system transport protein MerF [SAR324 cluster bacterium]|nr:mercury resistance system transport protein MerF [SAR324 cluster bacterium]
MLYGGIGTFVTGLCCFTPILVIGVAAAGAASIVAYLDYVLFPMLGFFMILTIFGVVRASRGHAWVWDRCPDGSGRG